MVASERKSDEEKGVHKVTFTLTVALAFPTGKLNMWDSLQDYSIVSNYIGTIKAKSYNP